MKNFINLLKITIQILWMAVCILMFTIGFFMFIVPSTIKWFLAGFILILVSMLGIAIAIKIIKIWEDEE